MNKIEKGMYIRTKYGKIGEIEGYISDLIYDYILTKDKELVVKKDITKASYNIIDLIEEGDYVNGVKVTFKAITKHENKLYTTPDNLNSSNVEFILDNSDIKSIVTKEQFKNMEYKI